MSRGHWHATEGDGWRPAAERFNRDFGASLDPTYDVDDWIPGTTWRQVQGEWDSPVELAVLGEWPGRPDPLLPIWDDATVVETSDHRERRVRKAARQRSRLTTSDRIDLAIVLERTGTR